MDDAKAEKIARFAIKRIAERNGHSYLYGIKDIMNPLKLTHHDGYEEGLLEARNLLHGEWEESSHEIAKFIEKMIRLIDARREDYHE